MKLTAYSLTVGKNPTVRIVQPHSSAARSVQSIKNPTI
jgi:hypothetical protein